jgi:fucose permease
MSESHSAFSESAHDFSHLTMNDEKQNYILQGLQVCSSHTSYLYVCVYIYICSLLESFYYPPHVSVQEDNHQVSDQYTDSKVCSYLTVDHMTLIITGSIAKFTVH